MTSRQDESISSFRLSGVSYTYKGGRRALWEVSLSWPRTGVVALLGPNGSGKSTLLSLVVGTRRPSSGTLSSTPMSVGFLPQAATWPGRFTARELLAYAAWWNRVPKSEVEGRISSAAAALDVEDVLDQRIGQLSGGYVRRLMVAQAVVHAPEVVVLDEPSAGLDPRQRVRLREAIAELGSERLVIVATHLVEDIDQIADHVTILDEGEVVVDSGMDRIRATHGNAPGSPLERLYLGVVTR
ncbi:ATP-binding cassette domain-containing protein [Yimella sp. cx-573]|nr:ATP-binding cassette domain-containing protein [Yimella sp. cx-573]